MDFAGIVYLKKVWSAKDPGIFNTAHRLKVLPNNVKCNQQLKFEIWDAKKQTLAAEKVVGSYIVPSSLSIFDSFMQWRPKPNC